MTKKNQKPVALLVAKSANSLKLVSKHLAAHFQVATAEDAESAWSALLENRKIALIISELELVIDKFGMLERLRAANDCWLAATPLLLLVGENDADADRELAFQAGATDFINLPFASTELSARARLHANLYEQQHQQPMAEKQAVSAVNVLQQLSQQNFFNSRTLQELSFSQRHRSSVSLCKLKMDNIKSIVAGFDKATAVKAVKSVAAIIQQTLRREDTLCYQGNAEFCLLYPATNGIGATAAVNRVFEKVRENELSIAGKSVPVTLSGAIYSCIANEASDLDDIYTRLDKSLARAQSNGGNQVISSTSGQETRILSIDRALSLIESGRVDDLSVHATELLRSVLPLLEFVDGVSRLNLQSINQELREALESEAGLDE